MHNSGPPIPHPRISRAVAHLSQLLLWCTLGTSVAGFAQTTPPTPETEQSADCTKATRDQIFKDLPNLALYATANAALPATPSDRRVVFMGDSITESWATVDPHFFVRPDFIDRGISGQTTLQMLLRFRQDVVALHPAVVHIMAGTNDIAGNTGPLDLPTTEANIASMVDIAESNGIHVVIASVPPAKDFGWHPGMNPGPKIAALNHWLKDYAKTKHLIYVDYHAALNDGALGMRPDLSPDGVHPSLPGYLLMDPLAQAAIRAALRH